MPNNKGSRVAASRARAKAAAKKRTHASGPDLSGATKPVVTTDPSESEGEMPDVAEATLEETVDTAAVHAPSPHRRAATRRERQSLAVVSSGNLKWELSLIGVIAAASGVILAVVKLATDIGR